MVRWQVTLVLSAAAAVAITGAALVAGADRMAADLHGKAAAALAPEVTSWADVRVDGRDVSLAGAAPSEELRRLAVDRVGRIFGVRSVDAGGTRLLPEAAPYTVTLTRDAAGLTIAGSAPSQPDRRRMVDALTRAVPGLAYNDRLTLARGMPDAGFLDTVAAVQPLLGLLSTGTITVTDRIVAIDGVAASNDAYGRFRTGAAALPPGYDYSGPTVARPVASPFTWSAESSGREARIAGFAPDPDARMRLYGVVRAGARRGPVVDTVALASGAPAGFADVAAQAADLIDLFAYGRVEVRDTAVSISGVAATPETWRTARAFLDAFKPAGYTVDAKVDLPVVTPFTLSASRSHDRITVSGFVPSEDAAGLVKAAAARIAGTQAAVIETTVAAGAPERFQDAAVFALGLLANLADGTVVVTDRTIAVTGAARTGADLIEIEGSAASQAPEGFTVRVDVTPPLVKPYVWAIEKKEDTIVLTGSVPSEEARAAIRAVAEDLAGDDRAVLDRTQLAAGLPQDVDLVAVARFAAKELAGMDGGFLTLNDDRLSVLGSAGTAKAGMAVVSAMDGRLPRAVKKGMVQIDFPPALRLSIERGLDAVTIDGTTAGPEMTAKLRGLVERAFGKADVELNLEEMPAMPDGAEAAALTAVRAASLLATGKVTIEGTVITAQGKAFTGIGAVRFSSDVAGAVPKGFRLDAAVGVAPGGPALADTAACAAALQPILAGNAVRFDGASAVIAADSHGFVDRIGGTAQRCGAATRLRVTGAAPDAADPGAAANLAKARADAVVKFLADVGVDPSRLVAGAAADPAAAGAPAVAIAVEDAAP